MEIRYVKTEDKEFWFQLDKHISEAEFEKKVHDRMGYILTEDSNPTAVLRYNLFWDNTPFCTMLFVDFPHQGKGYGKALIKHWEADMKRKGYGMVMTSTQVDESAQNFYRHMGYRDAGGFVMNIPGYEQPMEMIMMKGI